MKNLKKLSREELKTVKGGKAPMGCLGWNPIVKCCKSYQDLGYPYEETAPLCN